MTSRSPSKSKSLQDLAYSQYPDIEKEKMDTYILQNIHEKFTLI